MNLDDIEYLFEHKYETLTEEQIEFLIENRIEFIKNANRDKISTAHDEASANLSSDKIIDHIASKIDPTKNKAHTQWLVGRYKDGEFTLGQSKDVAKTVAKYEESKNHLENKDLNSYKSLEHLKDALVPVQSRVKAIKDSAKQVSEEQTVGMPVLFSDSEGNTAYQVPNKQVSIRNYGPAGKLANTKWCTAAAGSKNMFDGYDGNKYTLHLNNGHIIQLHHKSGQLKDINNREFTIDSDPRFKQHRPVIERFINETHVKDGSPNSSVLDHVVGTGTSKEELDDAINQHNKLYDIVHNQYTASNARYIDQELLSKHKAATLNLRRLTQRASPTDEQIDALRNVKTYDMFGANRTSDFTEQLTMSPHITPHALTKIVKDIPDDVANEYSNPMRQLHGATTHNNATHGVMDSALDKILSMSDPRVRTYAAEKFAQNAIHYTKQQIDRIGHIGNVKTLAIRNASDQANVPTEWLDHAISQNSSFAASHRSLTEEQATKLLNNTTDTGILEELSKNHSVPAHIAVQAHIKARSGYPEEILGHPDLKDDDVQHIINHKMDNYPFHGNSDWLSHPRITRDHFQTILRHKDATSFVPELVKSNRIRTADLDRFVASDVTTDDIADAVMKSHVAKSTTIDKVLQHRPHGKVFHSLVSDDMNPHIVTSQHLHSLLDSPEADRTDKFKVMSHPSVQLSHFQKMLEDPRFHGAISNSKNAPPSILHTLATSPMDHVRSNVVSNPNTEKRTFDILKTDANPEIAEVAKKKAK